MTEAFKGQNGCNLGVRLDHFSVIDPDTKAAGDLLNRWEQEGKLPPTVAWQTAAGNIKRLYQRPTELQGPLTIKEIKLQLRTGPGMQDVILLFYVKDAEKGIDGNYTWLPDQEPESIEPALPPDSILQYFLTHSNFKTNSSNYKKTIMPIALTFPRVGGVKACFTLLPSCERAA